ncbi:MAG: hypothetical protein ACLPID_03740 [Beijerinckiaceae bacterium]
MNVAGISKRIPLSPRLPASDRASPAGTHLVATATWNFNASFRIFAEYLRELAGPAITLAGGHEAGVGMVRLGFNF